MVVRAAAQKPRHRPSQSSPERLIIPCAGVRLVCRDRPLVMGILNVTPDSFSDGGRFADPGAAVAHGVQMAEEGADLIDIGGESTRPGAARVSVEDELRRVVPVVERLARAIRVPIAVDTSKAPVAARALAAGASIINDVTALQADSDMGVVAARARAVVILMHMQGTPATMQQHPRYRDVVEEVAEALLARVEAAQRAGIAAGRILLDPGLGFGKTVAHNLTLLANLSRFTQLGYPVVIGASRKSFIGTVLGGVPVEERLAGSLACVAAAAYSGVRVVRVHDVRPTVQLLQILEAINTQGRLLNIGGGWRDAGPPRARSRRRR